MRGPFGRAPPDLAKVRYNQRRLLTPDKRTLGFWHYQGSLMASRREAANREAKNQKA